jgi:hypothetical protein
MTHRSKENLDRVKRARKAIGQLKAKKAVGPLESVNQGSEGRRAMLRDSSPAVCRANSTNRKIALDAPGPRGAACTAKSQVPLGHYQNGAYIFQGGGL